MKRVNVVRHTLLFRVMHCLIVIEGLIQGITGLSLSKSLNIDLIGYGLARDIHVVTGLLFTATAIFFLYYFVASGEYNWYGLRRIGMGFDHFFAETKAWFLREHIDEPIRYDEKSGRHIEKVIPTEVLVWWVWFILGIAIVFSGLGLIFPEQLAYINAFWGYIFPEGFGGAAIATRIGHSIIAMMILFTAIFHGYAAWAYKMLRSIVFGDRDDPVS